MARAMSLTEQVRQLCMTAEQERNEDIKDLMREVERYVLERWGLWELSPFALPIIRQCLKKGMSIGQIAEKLGRTELDVRLALHGGLRGLQDEQVCSRRRLLLAGLRRVALKYHQEEIKARERKNEEKGI